MTNFRRILNHFNNLEAENIFNAPEVANELGPDVKTKEIHGFLTPAKAMGIIIKGKISNREEGCTARVEYLKVRSLTSDEIAILTNRQDVISFTKDLKRINKVPWEKVTGKRKVRKMISAQHTTRLTDSDIAKVCNVPLAFISKIRSDIAVPIKKKVKTLPIVNTVEKSTQKGESVMTERKGSYGRPMMKALTEKANALGNTVKFHINEDGKYVINDGEQVIKPPSAAAACHFLMGMVSSARNLKV